MKKRKTYLLLCLTWLMTQSGLCANEHCIMLWLKGGEQITYKLAQHPKVHYSEEHIVVVTDDLQIEYSQNELKKITFEEESNMDSMAEKTDGTGSQVYTKGNQMFMAGFSPNAKVSLVTVNGQHLDTYQLDAQGCLQIDIDKYPKGMYIVKTNETNVKILRK